MSYLLTIELGYQQLTKVINTYQHPCVLAFENVAVVNTCLHLSTVVNMSRHSEGVP